MPSDNSCKMWVFREGRTTVSGRVALDGLRSALARHFSALRNSCIARDTLMDALLRAGELECALADAGAPDTSLAAEITDRAAAALVELPGSIGLLESVPALLDAITIPAVLTTSPPEGFAYYAVHPLDFADLADKLQLQGASAAVVGIRSIGATLSAVVAAALARRGAPAERITVRPTGHPYDRRTTFSPEQLRWIARRRAALAHFLVVDEGPGLSGSSFLSVGDALLEAGAARERITFLGSRDANADALTARDGAARWRSFHFMVLGPTRHAPAERGAYIGGGDWRRHLYDEESQWPASWVQMERLKFLSNDGRRTFKFHGFGRFGAVIAERARLLGETGFGPRLIAHTSGFSEFERVDGRPMVAAQISAAVLERIADYCALRALEFAHPEHGSQLEAMVRFNVGEELGSDIAGSLPAIHNERLVIADGRMLPHEWLATSAGTLVKTDGATHGDDHFFPGPVDIAWDLAGAAIEWGMSAEAADYMLDRYRQRSGDDARGRMQAYLLAYSVFRMAYCNMAAFALGGSAEVPRLRRAAAHYRNLVDAQVRLHHSRTHFSGDRNPEWRQGGAGLERALALDDRGADRG